MAIVFIAFMCDTFIHTVKTLFSNHTVFVVRLEWHLGYIHTLFFILTCQIIKYCFSQYFNAIIFVAEVIVNY